MPNFGGNCGDDNVVPGDGIGKARWGLRAGGFAAGLLLGVLSIYYAGLLYQDLATGADWLFRASCDFWAWLLPEVKVISSLDISTGGPGSILNSPSGNFLSVLIPYWGLVATKIFVILAAAWTVVGYPCRIIFSGTTTRPTSHASSYIAVALRLWFAAGFLVMFCGILPPGGPIIDTCCFGPCN